MRTHCKANSKWKRAELERIRALSTTELLSETLGSGGGDDYDGCFTDRGGWTYDALIAELRVRLWIRGVIDLHPNFLNKYESN